MPDSAFNIWLEIPQITPSTATIEEMDSWLMAHGAEILDSEQLKAVVRKISWANVPGENPGDTEDWEFLGKIIF